MIVGIDATNIRAGGGMTHLLEIITHARPAAYGITKIVIWGGSQLDKLPRQPWLELRKIKALDGSAISRMSWILLHAKKNFASSCDILWSPGGTFYSADIPYISMSQNMLVFEKEERNRFPMSLTRLRYLLLNFFQSRSFRHAKGVIFLTQYARNYIHNQLNLASVNSVVIPHGVSTRFKHSPKEQRSISSYTTEAPFRILYVSIVNFYKHQQKLIESVVELRKKYPVELVLVGPIYPPCAATFYKSMKGHESYIQYKGKMDYASLNEEYHAADLFAFCSTCENMPNILIEAMSSGLPILSSSYGPMPEVLQDGGKYCDPLHVDEIVNSLTELLEKPELRIQLAKKSYALADKFSWQMSADQTLGLIKFCHDSENKNL